jgi:hypothetical protein
LSRRWSHTQFAPQTDLRRLSQSDRKQCTMSRVVYRQRTSSIRIHIQLPSKVRCELIDNERTCALSGCERSPESDTKNRNNDDGGEIHLPKTHQNRHRQPTFLAQFRIATKNCQVATPLNRHCKKLILLLSKCAATQSL